MRTCKASNLREYIDQLKHDVKVLETIVLRLELGDLTDISDVRLAERDTCENHSEIVDMHLDQLRQARNKILNSGGIL